MLRKQKKSARVNVFRGALLVLMLPLLSLASDNSAGLGEAAYRQGAAYLTGPQSDPLAAVAAWSRAEAENHPLATYNLAQMYLVGEGVEKDIERSRSLFEKSQSLGVVEAKQALLALPERVKTPETNALKTKLTDRTQPIFEAAGDVSDTCARLVFDEEGVRQWGEDNYEKPFLLQLFASVKCEQAAKYIGKLDGLDDAKIFLKRVGGEDIYAVMVGSFKDKAEAKDFAESRNISQAWAQSVFSLTQAQP